MAGPKASSVAAGIGTGLGALVDRWNQRKGAAQSERLDLQRLDLERQRIENALRLAEAQEKRTQELEKQNQLYRDQMVTMRMADSRRGIEEDLRNSINKETEILLSEPVSTGIPILDKEGMATKKDGTRKQFEIGKDDPDEFVMGTATMGEMGVPIYLARAIAAARTLDRRPDLVDNYSNYGGNPAAIDNIFREYLLPGDIPLAHPLLQGYSDMYADAVERFDPSLVYMAPGTTSPIDIPEAKAEDFLDPEDWRRYREMPQYQEPEDIGDIEADKEALYAALRETEGLSPEFGHNIGYEIFGPITEGEPFGTNTARTLFNVPGQVSNAVIGPIERLWDTVRRQAPPPAPPPVPPPVEQNPRDWIWNVPAPSPMEQNLRESSMFYNSPQDSVALSKAHPDFLNLYNAFNTKASDFGVVPRVTSGYREPELQRELLMNNPSGLPVARNSLHTQLPADAVDFKFLRPDGTPLGWTSLREKAIWDALGQEAENLGFEWGGRWNQYDPVHFQRRR